MKDMSRQATEEVFILRSNVSKLKCSSHCFFAKASTTSAHYSTIFYHFCFSMFISLSLEDMLYIIYLFIFVCTS